VKRLKEFAGSVGARDVLLFSGVMLLTVGAGMVYIPAAPITAGLIIFAISLVGIPKWH
jgi:hypothetical protein